MSGNEHRTRKEQEIRAVEWADAAIGLADLFGFFEDFAYLRRPFPVWLNKCLRDGERQQGVI